MLQKCYSTEKCYRNVTVLKNVTEMLQYCAKVMQTNFSEFLPLSSLTFRRQFAWNGNHTLLKCQRNVGILNEMSPILGSGKRNYTAKVRELRRKIGNYP